MREYTEQDYMHMAKAGALDIDFEFTLPVRAACDDDLRLSGWNPDTNKADCFELLEAISANFSNTQIVNWVPDSARIMIFKGVSLEIYGEGKTLQEAICTLAVEIGRGMEE